MFDKLYIAPILSPEGYISVLEKRAAAGFILRFGGLGVIARNKPHFDIGVKMPRLPFLSELLTRNSLLLRPLKKGTHFGRKRVFFLSIAKTRDEVGI